MRSDMHVHDSIGEHGLYPGMTLKNSQGYERYDLCNIHISKAEKKTRKRMNRQNEEESVVKNNPNC